MNTPDAMISPKASARARKAGPRLKQAGPPRKVSRGAHYTVRGVSPEIDRALRALAEKEGKSINSAALEALARGLDLGVKPFLHHNLDFLIGTWVEDPGFDAVMKDMERVDLKEWR